jgi:hypothetical protein
MTSSVRVACSPDISRREEAARAHGEVFAAVEVKGFIDREWLVEVEADCVSQHDV